VSIISHLGNLNQNCHEIHFTPTEIAIKFKKLVSVGKDVEKFELLFIVHQQKDLSSILSWDLEEL
jgi:hypothetical protein